MSIIKIFNANKERILTGLVLLGVAILIAVTNTLFVTWSVLGIAYIFAFYETMKLLDIKDNKLLVYAILLWIFAAFYQNSTDLVFVILLILVAFMAHKKKLDYKLLFPFIYPSIPMLLLLSLYMDYGMSKLIWLVFIVALTDTGAYVVGKSIGKTPFSLTSPNKTKEGVIGGIAIATLVGTFIGIMDNGFAVAFLTSLFVSTASIWGDLFESYLKREAGVKDSGNIFPGHGGFLDRLDGYLFAIIVMIVILRGIA
jgi:phosphatidate cytidylyltransferase